MTSTRQPGVSRFTAIAGAFLLALALLPLGAQPVEAATRPVRLEAGQHYGIHFTSAGGVIARKYLTLTKPTTYQTDRRRVVPNRSGIFIRITTGPLAGWEIRESLMAYVPGRAGDTAYSPAANVTFAAGRYLGYRFDSASGLASTRYASIAATTATAGRRAVIDGRPYVLMASGNWSGWWIPVTKPRGLTAQRLTCTAPGHVAAGSQQVFRTLPGGANEIALTFDMGGRLTPALDILERLVIDRVCTTIFPTGASAQTTTGQQVLAMIKAHPELFEVGNHTMRHCDLVNGGGGSATCPTTRPSATVVQKELTDAAAIIKAGTGQDPAPYWRPPYGTSDTSVRTAAAAVGYTKTMMWSIDTIDWRPISATPVPGPNALQIADKVVGNGLNGSMVLMHLGGYHTYDALPSMVSRLRSNGLNPTTVSQVLR